ncbi:hypothetical protein [Chromobacterium sp. ATCC 53434]|uniref:hypothetical protein n=1 Tax=Chromobacterium sp. (strain ATCC 53434 / SC 14030) TaxID=2059672 RepID=UPI0013051269|nr:hypothetical protein [Chromobacterium sp. ATCC 53434]
MPVSGRCSRSRLRGSLLLSSLLAASLTSLVLALSLAVLATIQREASDAERRMSRRQDARWAAAELARDLLRHGRFGCGARPWQAGDFGAGAWHLWLPGRELEIGRVRHDAAGRLEAMELVGLAPEFWRPWSRLWLGDCGSGRELAGGDAHWQGAGSTPTLRLTPAFDGAHLPSLQLWLPRERRYRLVADGQAYRLLTRERDGGLADGEERVLLDGVHSLSLQLLVADGCGEAARWSWRAPSDLRPGQLPQAARLGLAWYAGGGEDEVNRLSYDLALEPGFTCKEAS